MVWRHSKDKKIQSKTENYTVSVVGDETSRCCISVSVCQNFGQSETRLILERDQARSKALKIELQIKRKLQDFDWNILQWLPLGEQVNFLPRQTQAVVLDSLILFPRSTLSLPDSLYRRKGVR